MFVNIILHPPEISLKNLLSVTDIESLKSFFSSCERISSKDLFEGFQHVLGIRCPSKESVEFLFKKLGFFFLLTNIYLLDASSQRFGFFFCFGNKIIFLFRM
jgi:hypothetical protein